MPESAVKELEYRLQVADHDRTRLKKRLAAVPAQDRSSVLSMLDMITLLLLFFIMLYVKSAMNHLSEHTDPSPCAVPADASASQALSDPPSNAIPVSTQTSVNNPASPISEDPDPALAGLEQEIADLMKQQGTQEAVFGWDQRRLVFVLGERITFNLGQADLLMDFEPILTKIAQIIAGKPQYRILVSGHTDDQPINTQWFPSNWELSASRAIAVAKFLTHSGVSPDRITIQGFGEYQPMVPNSSSQNRQINRRVEIRMVRQPVENTP
jgi:chemotaxis protein MotB